MDRRTFVKLLGFGAIVPLAIGTQMPCVKLLQPPSRQAGHYVLHIGKRYRDLGVRPKCLILTLRPIAISSDGAVTRHNFKFVQQNIYNKKYSCGFEFLLYLPATQGLASLVKLGCGGRRQAWDLLGKIHEPIRLTTWKITHKKWTWYTIGIEECGFFDIKMPGLAKTIKQWESTDANVESNIS